MILALIALFLFAAGDVSASRQRLSTILDTADRGYAVRAEIWKEAVGAWRAHPVWGTGFGTFAGSAGPYFGTDYGHFWSHAENEYVHVLVEGGTVGFGLALAGLVGVARLARRALAAAPSPRSRGVVLGAAYGGVALAAHSLSDFGLHVPGVAVPAVILCAHLCRLGVEAGDAPRGGGTRRAGGLGPLLGGLAMTLLAFGVASHGLNLWRAEALVGAAGLPMPGAEQPTPGRGNLPARVLERKRSALEEAVRVRPDWAEGHTRLGLVYLSLYEQTAAEWAGGTLDDPEVARLADPLWLFLVVHAGKPGRSLPAGELLGHEPVRRYLVPAARSFLEARRCGPASALVQAELAGLDYLLEGGDPSAVYVRRALRLAGSQGDVIDLAAREAVGVGDLDLASLCWRRSLEVRRGGWAGIADAAGAVLTPDRILDRIVTRGDHSLWFAERLYAGPEDRANRDQFLKAAIARLPGDRDLSASERYRLEAEAWAGLGDRARARDRMKAALGLEPLRTPWRRELVDWLLEWGETSEAHDLAVLGAHLTPGDPDARSALGRSIEALAREAAAPGPSPESP